MWNPGECRAGYARDYGRIRTTIRNIVVADGNIGRVYKLVSGANWHLETRPAGH